MASSFRDVVDLVNDPICRLMMTRDGVAPTDVFNMMRTVRPIVGGRLSAGPMPRRSDAWPDCADRRGEYR